ncbi:minor tail protein [Gordonia phage MintFen]|nr:minor tail protein [Gordonia phage Barco]QDB74532.1 minor tail protein [Gordonia phage Melba]QDH85349.1 minor tail protein [Gordonia phage MintFen]
MSPPPEGRDRHYWPDSEPDADRLGATQVIPARGASKITMPPPQSADRMSLQERANAIFGEVGTKFEVTEVASGVDNVATNIRNAVAGGVAVGVGVVREVFDNVAGLFGIADNAEKIAMAAQQQLQDITNETNVPGWSGYSWSTIFSGADGTPLPSTDWATSRIAIVGDDGHAGIINNSTDGDHFCTVRNIHKFATDSQSASIVVGKKWSFSEDRWTSIRLRCDSENPTQGAVCWVRPGNIRIGRFSGGTNTIWYTVGQPIKPGDIVRFRCHGDNYYVLVNGKVVVSWTDTGASVSKGAGFRHAAFTQEYLNGLLADQASFQVASWAMADWLPPGGAVTTPAWRLRRGVGSAVALTIGHGAQAQMPASFYTVNDLSSGVTVTDLGSGQITITETGWYEIAASSTNVDNSDAVSGLGTQAALADAYRPTLWVLYVDGVAVAGPIMAGVATTVYLAAGQVVRTGVSASWPFTSSASGDSSGFSSYSRSNITHVSGAPSASFTGRKVA